MGAIPYAISVHHFVSTVGADAGFAAIIGLAILILLFFSQARETSTLRRRADESDEQVRQLEFQLAQLSRAPQTTAPPVAPAPAVAPAPPSVQRTVAPAGAAVGAAAAGAAGAAVASRSPRPATPRIPAAPAGVGAPALSSATRLIPAGAEDPISIRAAGDADATGAATTGAAAPTASADQSSGGVLAPPGPPPAAPPPSTAAAGANGGGVGSGAAGVAGAAAGRPARPRPVGPHSRLSVRRDPRRPGHRCSLAAVQRPRSAHRAPVAQRWWPAA